MPPEDLVKALHVNELPDEELHHILLSYFHAASQNTTGDVIFPGDLGNYAIKLVYKKNRLVRIDEGPKLKTDDISALTSIIEAQLQPRPQRLATEVLFSSWPVNGYFKYDDMFQVLPPPQEAPTAGSLWATHPFLLQFKYKPSNEGVIGLSHRQAQRRKLELLLAGVLEGHIYSLGSQPRFHWVLPKPNGPPEATSSYRQEGYVFPRLGEIGQREEFSALEGLLPLPAVDPEEYYTRLGKIHYGGLEVPQGFKTLLDRFFSLGNDDQDSFLRSCFWLSHARTVHTYSISAAFTALLSALESLISLEEPVGKCLACQRPIRRGSTRRLAALFDQFAPRPPKFNAARAALLYQFRSSLTHGGALAYEDRKTLLLGMTPESSGERDLMVEVRQLVKVILVNWLHSRSPLLIPSYRGPRMYKVSGRPSEGVSE